VQSIMNKYKILLVDDEPIILKAIGRDLEMEGYHVTPVRNGEQALEALERANFDLVITDLIMDRIDGITVLKRAKEIDPETLVIILTGFGDMASAIDALRLDADDYLLKPCGAEEMHFRVGRCIEKLELTRKLKIYEKVLPVCCECKKIRDDTGKEPGMGEWLRMEDYLRDRGKTEVTSSYCPECSRKLREELKRLRRETPTAQAG
jgi:DNA-binding NtrC family response regulator